MKRRQVSLYLNGQSDIEALRSRYNPMQARLIPPHVTLCREDEVTDWGNLQNRLELLRPFEIAITFGVPVREDNFVYLPVLEGLEVFQSFRRAILSKEARIHFPHLTLIHPRNGICTEQIFADISKTITEPFPYTFREVRIIEQEDGGIWNVISRV
jgi:hypothetical protein